LIRCICALRGAVAFGTVESALYYTFSTIAQALAAAMAILAAFAMYRLNAIDVESSGAANMIESETGGGVFLRQHSYVSHWKKCIDAADRRISEVGATPELLALRDQLWQLRIAARTIRIALWIAVTATALVMAGSVAALAYVPSICRAGLAQSVLGCGVFGFAACLVAYGWLIWKSFRFSHE
jgi:hypothetical protein